MKAASVWVHIVKLFVSQMDGGASKRPLLWLWFQQESFKLVPLPRPIWQQQPFLVPLASSFGSRPFFALWPCSSPENIPQRSQKRNATDGGKERTNACVIITSLAPFPARLRAISPTIETINSSPVPADKKNKFILKFKLKKFQKLPASVIPLSKASGNGVARGA